MVARKTNILVVIRHPVGGIRTYLKYTYRYLDKSKYQMTVLTVKDFEGSLLKEDLSGFNFKVIEVSGRFILLQLVWRTFQALLRQKFDLIHSQGFTAGLIAVLGNFIFRTPHILTSHDVFRKEQFTSWGAGFKKWLLSLLLDQADFIQSVSYDAQENLIYYLPALRRKRDKLMVIHNGVLTDQSTQKYNGDTATSFRNEIGIGNSIFLFGFLGRFMPQKGFDNLIDAVEELSENLSNRGRFRIAVVNDGAYIREYKKIITDKGLSEYFIFYGFTPSVSRVLISLDALLVPSRWEAYGLIAAEAMVIGCTVIAANCIGLREVTKNTPAIVLKVGNSESLSNALREFMNNPELYKQRAKEFVSEARVRFDSRRTAEQLGALFEKVISLRKEG
jgi:glycosyltransferase involved in cell wall biosynthesis